MINNYLANYAMKKGEVAPDPIVCIIYIYDNYIWVYLPYDTKSEIMFNNVKKSNGFEMFFSFSILSSYCMNLNSFTITERFEYLL